MKESLLLSKNHGARKSDDRTHGVVAAMFCFPYNSTDQSLVFLSCLPPPFQVFFDCFRLPRSGASDHLIIFLDAPRLILLVNLFGGLPLLQIQFVNGLLVQLLGLSVVVASGLLEFPEKEGSSDNQGQERETVLEVSTLFEGVESIAQGVKIAHSPRKSMSGWEAKLCKSRRVMKAPKWPKLLFPSETLS